MIIFVEGGRTDFNEIQVKGMVIQPEITVYKLRNKVSVFLQMIKIKIQKVIYKVFPMNLIIKNKASCTGFRCMFYWGN